MLLSKALALPSDPWNREPMKKKFIAKTLGICIATSTVSSSASAKTISDSLVSNLSCQALSVGAILGKIRPSAFSANNHLPVKNWAFRSGMAELGACWGLGSTQRKLFYLMRLNEKNAPALDTRGVLDMIRGARVEASSVLNDTEIARREPELALREYRVIPVSERNISEEFGRNTGLGFLDLLLNGVTYTIDSNRIHRNFRTEVERSQELHFFRSRNIGMGAGSGPLRPATNAKTLRTLLKNMDLKRLTLINLRLKTTVQHIVIAKTYVKDAKGNVWIRAYDSNQPQEDKLIYFARSTGHFYSPQIMGPLVGDISGSDYHYPLGVFIVDESEREKIEATLLKHYTERCRN